MRAWQNARFRPKQTRSEAAVWVSLLFCGCSNNVPMLRYFALSHPEYVCQSISGRSNCRGEAGVQENHVSLSNSSNYLPSGAWHVSDDLCEKAGGCFPRSFRHVRFVLDELGSHVVHECLSGLTADKSFVVEGKHETAVRSRGAIAFSSIGAANHCCTPLQRQGCYGRTKHLLSHMLYPRGAPY